MTGWILPWGAARHIFSNDSGTNKKRTVDPKEPTSIQSVSFVLSSNIFSPL